MSDYGLTPAAETDLEEIWQYTFRTRSAEKADSYIDDLFDVFELLGQNPGLGQKAEGVSAEYRRLPTNHHLIFYRTNQIGFVQIARILHERSDVAHRLDEELIVQKP